jgi:hypothetical protein
MLMALALLAAIDAVPASTVSLTLSGETDRPPVSAARRSLSDVARELRAGRKAVGGFSAAESTLPQSQIVFVPMIAPELETREPEPEVVTEAQPVYVPTYLPVWFGGHQKTTRHRHRRPTAHLASPRPASPLPGRSSARPMFRPQHTTAGILRER